jgi:5-methylcytosine-specific restriction endonuclease McrA
MQTNQYKNWRSSVFERDLYTCQECGLSGVRLEADHIKPWNLYPKLRYEISNGKTLCIDCHRNKTSEEHKTHWSNQYERSFIN